MTFPAGTIADVVWKPLNFYRDSRGWLTELFRNDDVPAEYRPVMAYVSMTDPGVARGPHEHVEQADYFCFIGPGVFRVYLWDARKESPTFGHREVKDVGDSAPFALIVPPGVVHAYKNVSAVSGIVFNAANTLYAGEGRKGWRGPKGSPGLRGRDPPRTSGRVGVRSGLRILVVSRPASAAGFLLRSKLRPLTRRARPVNFHRAPIDLRRVLGSQCDIGPHLARSPARAPARANRPPLHDRFSNGRNVFHAPFDLPVRGLCRRPVDGRHRPRRGRSAQAAERLVRRRRQCVRNGRQNHPTPADGRRRRQSRLRLLHESQVFHRRAGPRRAVDVDRRREAQIDEVDQREHPEGRPRRLRRNRQRRHRDRRAVRPWRRRRRTHRILRCR